MSKLKKVVLGLAIAGSVFSANALADVTSRTAYLTGDAPKAESSNMAIVSKIKVVGKATTPYTGLTAAGYKNIAFLPDTKHASVFVPAGSTRTASESVSNSSYYARATAEISPDGQYYYSTGTSTISNY